MRIRVKFVLIVLPLVIAPLLLFGLTASLAARNGITRVATGFLKFKTEELKNYAATQWNLLVENGLSEQADYVAVSKSAVASFARSLIRSDTELILAVEAGKTIALRTGELELSDPELVRLFELADAGGEGWQQITLGGVPRVAETALFRPFDWYFLVTESQESFYQAVSQIFRQSGLILAFTLVAALILLMVFTRYLTRPIRNVVGAMKEIIISNDLSKRVELTYDDETGELGHTFNLMTGELERAYNTIKSYAFKAAVAQRQEQKIRNIFQKYVPADVIDQYFTHPESMLVGESRVLAVLFSDIRGFTGIAESMQPAEIVESLNAYFSLMVEIIYKHEGIVDKYIGDAIMAFYGAPVKHENDALAAVYSGFEMLDALKDFNRRQASLERPVFRIGIGLNYGLMTVGNIGSDRKMDYTVMGDMVNLASRLEGLTKIYDVPFIISESVRRKVGDALPCRLIDTVAVRGKKAGVRIYHPRQKLSGAEIKGWKIHHAGIKLYYRREFAQAARYFRYAEKYLPEDPILRIFLARCSRFAKSPPPPDWQGVEIISEK
jgi:adenylate cyclase